MPSLNSRSPDFHSTWTSHLRQNIINERDVCFLSIYLGLQDVSCAVEWVQEREAFIDFLSGVLNLDPARRWTPRQVNPGVTHTTCDARDLPHVILNRHLLPSSLSIHPPPSLYPPPHHALQYVLILYSYLAPILSSFPPPFSLLISLPL